MGDLFHENVKSAWIDKCFKVMHYTPRHTYIVLTKRPAKARYYFSYQSNFNIWLGITAENHRTASERIPILLQPPAATRFVSVEPMLGPIDLSPYLSELDWVICGCESGPGARPMNVEWVPFFLKQMMINGKKV